MSPTKQGMLTKTFAVSTDWSHRSRGTSSVGYEGQVEGGDDVWRTPLTHFGQLRLLLRSVRLV